MANLDFSMFGNEQLSLSDMQDRLIGLQRQMNWGLRNLDSINVKRINTEITVIKSEGGEMDLTGRQLRMYDETSSLRFRVGLSTAGIYDMTLWSSNAATTDYDYSSNASMYINSSGEAVFADSIKTGKDAIVGRNLFVGKNNTTDIKSVRLQAYSTGHAAAEDLAIRTKYIVGGLLGAEFGMLHSSDNSTDPIRDLESLYIKTFQGVSIEGQFVNLVGIGAGSIGLTCDTAILEINGQSTGLIQLYAGTIVLNPASKAFKYTTASSNEIATVGMLGTSAGLTSDQAMTNFSSDRRLSMDFTTGGAVKLYQNSSLACSLAQCVHSTRVIQLDFTTALDNFLIYRNSTKIAGAVLAQSSNAYKLSWDSVNGMLKFYENGVNQANFVDKAKVVTNVSTDRKLSMDFTTGGAAKLFQNSSLACSLVQGINSTRVINLDYTTDHDNFNVYQNGVLQGSVVMHNSSNGLVLQTTAMGSGQMIRVIKQSSQIAEPIMDYTTGLNIQIHVRRLTSTELYFPSTGVWVIFYSSGSYMGKFVLSV